MLTVAGKLVGGMEKMLPKEEKQKAARITARMKNKRLKILIPRARPIITGTTDIIKPKAKEARMSPKMIVSIIKGQDINLSRVLAWVSQGTTIGDMAVAVKKRIIPRRPGIMKATVRFLPMVKARKRKTGKRRPKMSTGP